MLYIKSFHNRELRKSLDPSLSLLFFWMAFFIIGLIFTEESLAEKLYVVERERESIAVIEEGRLSSEIMNVGNMNHGIVKFYGGSAYVIGRDGYISKIDAASNKVIRKVKVGNSGIGFIGSDNYVAVANYDPGNVIILDRDLNAVKTIWTDSRNVGIKKSGNLLVFSLMDRDEIWVLDEKMGFEVLHRINNVGEMPFDAFLKDNTYVAGMFNEGSVGLLDLETMKYLKRDLRKKDNETVFKIPHFGTWGVVGNTAFIPAVGERKVHIVDFRSFNYLDSVKLSGLPVFVTTSPDGKYVAVNYSGDRDNHITIIDTLSRKVLKDIKGGKRVMHLRFSSDGKRLYLSSYFDHKVKIIEVGSWRVVNEIKVPTPSGIFIVE